jgi:hypothetical protein
VPQFLLCKATRGVTYISSAIRISTTLASDPYSLVTWIVNTSFVLYLLCQDNPHIPRADVAARSEWGEALAILQVWTLLRFPFFFEGVLLKERSRLVVITGLILPHLLRVFCVVWGRLRPFPSTISARRLAFMSTMFRRPWTRLYFSQRVSSEGPEVLVWLRIKIGGSGGIGSWLIVSSETD